MILIGHNITELRKLPEKSVHCCITSPPYWGLRDYGTDPQTWGGKADCQHDWIDATVKDSRHSDNKAGQKQQSNQGSVGHRTERPGSVCRKCGAWLGELGSEPTPEMFVGHMVEVFAEVWRVLRDDGTCWVNLGDSYANDGKWGGHTGGKHARALHASPIGRNKKYTGLKPKDLIGIPWRVAFALQAAGWYLRQDIIWHKPNPMPESVRDRCTKAHEYLFLITKSERYFFDGDACSEKAIGPAGGNTKPNKSYEHDPVKHRTKYDPVKHRTKAGLAAAKTRARETGGFAKRTRRSVWSISTHSYKGAHFATYPPRLVEPCILAGTSAKGCCPHCGKPWLRVVESKRVATRPGEDSKVCFPAGWATGKDHSAMGHQTAENHLKVTGNRDPQRHVSVKVTTGWQQACKCEAHEPVPCTVLDPFWGSGTTAIVAAHHGRKWIICELNPQYATLAEQRIAEGWTPPKAKKPRRKRHAKQKALFNAEAC